MNEPTVKKTRKNGKFVNYAGPGRPKGSRNRYTGFISDLFEVWEEVDGRSKLKEFIQKDRNFGKYLEVMSKLMPKEIKLSGDFETELTINKDYTGMNYEQLAREFDQKIRATRSLLGESRPSSN